MDMHLQPLATTCFVSGEAFVDGARVASHLVRGAALEIVRYDALESHATRFAPEGFVACKWVHVYKARRAGENPDRALKLTAENLFVALADPTTEPTPENTRLVQFLALMLERKKILRPKGRSADGARNRYEHARSKAMFEIPAGDLTPEFFVAVQEQLSVLVGAPKAKDPGALPAEPAAIRDIEPAEPAKAPLSAELSAATNAPLPTDSPAPAAPPAPTDVSPTADETPAGAPDSGGSTPDAAEAVRTSVP